MIYVRHTGNFNKATTATITNIQYNTTALPIFPASADSAVTYAANADVLEKNETLLSFFSYYLLIPPLTAQSQSYVLQMSLIHTA